MEEILDKLVESLNERLMQEADIYFKGENPLALDNLYKITSILGYVRTIRGVDMMTPLYQQLSEQMKDVDMNELMNKFSGFVGGQK